MIAALLFNAPPTWAFLVQIHKDVTLEALRSISRPVRNQTIGFTEAAIFFVQAENARTDFFFGGFLDPINHFDDEQFARASKRLMDLKNEIIANIVPLSGIPPNGAGGRLRLGRALHTLQDFYAHTNWVETDQAGINTDLGHLTLPDPTRALAFCPDNPNVLGGIGLVELTSGYFSNLFQLALLNALPNVPPEQKGCGPLPVGKCYHGLSLASGSVNIFCEGIHKDATGRPNHSMARSLAQEATVDYVNQILDSPRVAGNAKAIEALFGVSTQTVAETTGSLTYVIDDSGSMDNDIGRVRSSVRTTVSQTISGGTPQRRKFRPVEFGLVRFADRIEPPLFTRSKTELFSRVDEIMPSGGDDCPEAVMGALLRGLGASLNNSVIILYTDAPSANDGNLLPAFNALKKSKNALFYYLNLPNDCGRSFRSSSSSSLGEQNGSQSIDSLSLNREADETDDETDDQSLTRLLEETADQVFELSDPSDLDRISDQLSLLISGDLVTISRGRGTLNGDTQEFLVPIDSTVTLVSFSVTRDTDGSVSLTRPSGKPVLPSDPGVAFTEIPSGIFITVEAPEPGEWHLSVSGSGDFIMAAQADSPIDLFNFEFVELINPAHDALAPISGNPVAGTAPTSLANLMGPFATADEFRLVDEAGDTLQTINLVQGGPNAAANEFVGSFSLPRAPFHVAVSGLDENGNAYSRLFPTLFRAQSVKVTVDPATAVDRLSIGATTKFRFNVLNEGSPGNFQLQAVDTQGFVSRVSPDLLTLGTNETGIFEVEVTVPAGTAEGVEVSLVATATSTANPTLTNSATITLLTASQPNTICGGFAATIVGAPRDDFLVGTNDNDVIHGLEGNDIIRAFDGNDTICGGDGNDNLDGGSGVDTCIGDRGTDTVVNCETGDDR